MKRQENFKCKCEFGAVHNSTSTIILVECVKDTLSTHVESEGAANVATKGVGC